MEKCPKESTRMSREHRPEHARDVEHDRLQCQHKRHPLIVSELALRTRVRIELERTLHNVPVGILNEAVVFHITLPAVLQCKVSALEQTQ